MTDNPTDVLVWFPPPPMSRGSAVSEFRRRTGSAPGSVIAAAGRIALLRGGHLLREGVSGDGGIRFFLMGDLPDAGADAASGLAGLYAQRGEAFARDVNGSWIGLVFDEPLGRVLLFTDRLNSRRVYHCATDGYGDWISTDIPSLPTAHTDLDPVGIAWFLTNGAMHCGRTPFRDVTVLEAGSLHELDGQAVRSTRYWQFPFPPDREGGDEEASGARLIELLDGAVRRCARDTANLWLSISGGYDSRLIATLASEAGASGTRSFSYCHGEVAEGTDAWVGREVARAAGFDHWLIESYRGNLAGHIALNARLGQGVAPVCDEIDGWCELGRMAQGGERPVLLVGDHFLPDRPEAGPALEKKYPPGKIRGFDVLSWIAPRIPEATRRCFQHGLESDTGALHARIGHAPTRIDNLIYLEERLPNVVLAWRQAFAGPYFDVRIPFLDNEVMDFLATLPGPVLRSTFYHDAVKRFYPRAFEMPLAVRPGYYPPVREEIARHADALRQRLHDSPSRLDEVVPPDLGAWLIDRVVESRELLTRVRGRAERLLGREGRANGSGAPRVSEHVLLRRYLVLREALSPVETVA